MRRRRYVRKDEIKTKDRLPANGQAVLFRITGHKSYIRGWYLADDKTFFTPSESELHLRYIQGWLPWTRT